MTIEMPTKENEKTWGDLVVTIANEGKDEPDVANPYGDIELIADDDGKVRKWRTWHKHVRDRFPDLKKGDRWLMKVSLKKGDRGIFRNIEGLVEKVEGPLPAATIAAIANPKASDDWTDKERAMNRRTALMQAVVMVSSKDTIESGPLPLTLVFADAFYEWLERTNQPPGGAEAPLATPEAQEEAADQNDNLDQTFVDMEEAGFTRIAFRKWAHEERGIDWQQPQKPTVVIPLIGEFVTVMLKAAD